MKVEVTTCDGCSLCGISVMGFAQTTDYICTRTHRPTTPKDYCSKAEPGNPQNASNGYDVSICGHAIVNGNY